MSGSGVPPFSSSGLKPSCETITSPVGRQHHMRGNLAQAGSPSRPSRSAARIASRRTTTAAMLVKAALSASVFALRDAHRRPGSHSRGRSCHPAGDPVGDARQDRPGLLAQELQVAGHVGVEGEGAGHIERHMVLVPGCRARHRRSIPVPKMARSPTGTADPCGREGAHCLPRPQGCGFGNQGCSRPHAAAEG